MSTVLPSAAPRATHRSSRRLAFGALAVLALGALGVGTTAYLGRGPAPITVTDASGGATFNFRVTGIPVPGKIEGVTPQLTFTPQDLTRTRGLLTVPLATLDTGIALRDKHARTYLGVPTHPVSTFTVQKLQGAKTIRPGQTLNVVVQGTLKLNGVSVPLQAPVTLTFLPDGSAIQANTHFDVTFKDHGIAIPGADPKTDVKVAFRLPVRS